MYDSFPVFRGILDHWIYEDAEYLKVWVTMLAKAKYTYGTEKKVYMGIAYEISRGEFIFGRPTWVKDCKISEARLKLLMKRLIAADMIRIIKKYNRFTIYKVVNYEKFNQQKEFKNELEDELEERRCEAKQENFNQQNDQQNDQQITEQYQDIQDIDIQQNDQQNDRQKTSEHPAKDQRTSNNKESKEVKNIFLSDSNEYRLAVYLKKYILKNNPTAKVPDEEGIQKWCKTMDLILRVDKRAMEDVKKHIEYSQTDSFWMTNVLSADKLRKQYDQLTLKMKQKKAPLEDAEDREKYID